jgi:hypothetical protein
MRNLGRSSTEEILCPEKCLHRDRKMLDQKYKEIKKTYRKILEEIYREIRET